MKENIYSYYKHVESDLDFTIIARITSISKKVVKYESFFPILSKGMMFKKVEQLVNFELLPLYSEGFEEMDNKKGEEIFDKLERAYSDYESEKKKIDNSYNQKIASIFNKIK